jgi:hypothetical protein
MPPFNDRGPTTDLWSGWAAHVLRSHPLEGWVHAMRTFTMQGVAPDPNWQRPVKAHRRIESEPVFRLNHEHQRYSAAPTLAGWAPQPPVQGLSPRPSVPEERRPATKEIDELGVADPIGVRVSWRPVVVRIAGLLALAGALYGVFVIFGHSMARQEVLSWVTLGYADVVPRAAH